MFQIHITNWIKREQKWVGNVFIHNQQCSYKKVWFIKINRLYNVKQKSYHVQYVFFFFFFYIIINWYSQCKKLERWCNKACRQKHFHCKSLNDTWLRNLWYTCICRTVVPVDKPRNHQVWWLNRKYSSIMYTCIWTNFKG